MDRSIAGLIDTLYAKNGVIARYPRFFTIINTGDRHLILPYGLYEKPQNMVRQNYVPVPVFPEK